MAKPIKTKNEGETITETPSRVRCRYQLSNGQMLSVYFTRKRARGLVGPGIMYIWFVGVYVGSRGRKEANTWFHGPGINRSTGKCGLEALAVACRYVLAFGAKRCRSKEEMQISWADGKRMRAYKYLLRFPGFTLYEDETKRPICIAYRNPEIYEWIATAGWRNE